MQQRAAFAGASPPPAAKVEQDRAQSCVRAREGLQTTGVPLSAVGGDERYERLHVEWDSASSALLQHFGYDADARGRDRR